MQVYAELAERSMSAQIRQRLPWKPSRDCVNSSVIPTRANSSSVFYVFVKVHP